jgi:hypothetical protein
MSGKLSAKYHFEPVDNFSQIVSDKMTTMPNEED